MIAARLPGRRAARWAGRHERHRDGRARPAVLEDVGAAGLHAGDPVGSGGRSGRAERGGENHPDAYGRRPDRPHAGPGDGARRPARRVARDAEADGVRRPGCAAVPAPAGRGHGAGGADTERRPLGSAPGRPAARRPGHPGPPQGRQALWGPAGPGRAHDRAGAAARVPGPRRAARAAGSAGPARVPGLGAGDGGRGRHVGPVLLARGRRARTGCRLPGRADRRPGAGRRGCGNAAGPARSRAPGRGGDLMTALTSAARQAGRWRRPLPASVTSLAWAVWRQHRSALTWLGALLLALGATMLVAGIELHRLYAAEIRLGCLGSSAWSHACRPLQNTFGFGWPQTYTGLVVLVMQAVPVIVGVFLGAPLLARGYTAGTVRFAWTQGIGRTRWAVATLGLLASAVATAACLLGLLLQWSVQPVAAQTSRLADRWEPGVFSSTPLTAATAAVLAFAIGVLAGALIRRVVPAMAVTAVCTITVANLTYNR